MVFWELERKRKRDGVWQAVIIVLKLAFVVDL